MSQPRFSNVYALIIAVNQYQSGSIPGLGGCVSDAESVADYFTSALRIPHENLCCLFDSNARRQSILEKFRSHLIQNDKIEHSDPIIIYFSGHGTRQQVPTGWHASDGYMDIILPHDAGCYQTGASGEQVYTHGIPDRTFGGLIYELRRAKGDNITVILDCCFSGGATTLGKRATPARERSVRIPNTPPIPPNLDEDIMRAVPPELSNRVGHMSITQWPTSAFQPLCEMPSLKTHVLLAACKKDEKAVEIPVNMPSEPEKYSGLFTTALLKAIQECDLATTSYRSVMKPVERHARSLSRLFENCGTQTPQCEGVIKDRLLFRPQLGLSKGMIPLAHDLQRDAFRIKAGSASGIQEGTELGVYTHGTTEPIARLVATHVQSTESELRFKDTASEAVIPQDAYVVVTKYTGYSIRVLADERLRLNPVWHEVLHQLETLQIGVVWSKPGGKSDLVLVPTDRGVEIQRTDPSLIQLNPRPIVLETQLGANNLTRKLAAIIHFHFHLQRRNPTSPLKGRVGLKLIELLCTRSYPWGGKEYAPRTEHPDDLFGDSLSTGSVARIRATDETRYGLELTNRSNSGLYAWVLYFDLEDYSIECLYEPPSRGMYPPHQALGKPFAIGYGDSGYEPLRVENSGFSEQEKGVFMLFLSNQWVDLSHLEQPSIYEMHEHDGRELKRQPVNPASDIWDIVTVGVSVDQY